MLITSIILITLALVFYSIGVWAEKIKGVLKTWHVLIFWCGFACDTIATSTMSILARNETANNTIQTGTNIHAFTGVLAIVLMLFHAVWATFVIVKNNEKMKLSFHKFSLFVWIIWLIPYLSGMINGMIH